MYFPFVKLLFNCILNYLKLYKILFFVTSLTHPFRALSNLSYNPYKLAEQSIGLEPIMLAKYTIEIYLIADERFELPNRGVRVLCLTAWRIGNNKICFCFLRALPTELQMRNFLTRWDSNP